MSFATAQQQQKRQRRTSRDDVTNIESLPVVGPLGIVAEFLPAVERFGTVRRVSRHFRALPRPPMVFLETDTAGVWLPVYNAFLYAQSDLTPQEWAALEDDQKSTENAKTQYYRLRNGGNQRFSASTISVFIDGLNLLRGERPHIRDGPLLSAVSLAENGVQPHIAAWVERVWATLSRPDAYSVITLTHMLKMQALTKVLAASVALQIKRSLLLPLPPGAASS